MSLSSIASEQKKQLKKLTQDVSPTPQLSGFQSGCKNQVSRIRHDHEHPLGCIIPFRTKRSKSHMRIFFHGINAQRLPAIKLNGAFHVNTQIMKFVVASAAEAELGALFQNCQDGIMFWSTLHNLGHPQPRTRPLR
jgi:hypothetical protein